MLLKEASGVNNGPSFGNNNQRKYAGSHHTPTLSFVQQRTSSAAAAVASVGLSGQRIVRVEVPAVRSREVPDSVSVESGSVASGRFEPGPINAPSVPPTPVGRKEPEPSPWTPVGGAEGGNTAYT